MVMRKCVPPCATNLVVDRCAQSVRDNAALNEFEWQLLSYWLPTIVSATVLLVFMKGELHAAHTIRAATALPRHSRA